MIKGVIGGTLSGVLVSGAVLVGASQLVPPVELRLPEPKATPVEVPPGTPFSANLPDEAPVLPETETPPTAAVPELASAAPVITAPEVDTSTAAAPVPGTVEAEMSAPEVPSGADVSPSADDKLVISDATRPNTPGLESDPEAAQAPLTSAAPEVAALEAEPSAPELDTAPDAPSVEAPAVEAPVVEASSDSIEAPEVETALDSASAPDTVTAETGAPSLVQVGEAPALSQVPAQFPSPDAPSLSQPELAPAPEADTAALPPEPGPSGAAAGPAIEVFAAPFSPASEKPRLGIVLLDGPGVDISTLADAPVPLAVAVDPLNPDAALRMAELRAAGVEVLTLAPIAPGSSPSDVAVAFQAFLSAVPQAVGVMDLPAALLQSSRPLSSQVVDIAKASGHGLLSYEKGLNSILQIADGEGVPAMTVTRVFDTGDSDASRMRRFLDQGAFDATRIGRGVLVGHLRPETLATLADWRGGNRAQSIELAPVSAVLTRK